MEEDFDIEKTICKMNGINSKETAEEYLSAMIKNMGQQMALMSFASIAYKISFPDIFEQIKKQAALCSMELIFSAGAELIDEDHFYPYNEEEDDE
jgi:hypothetical protein